MRGDPEERRRVLRGSGTWMQVQRERLDLPGLWITHDRRRTVGIGVNGGCAVETGERDALQIFPPGPDRNGEGERRVPASVSRLGHVEGQGEQLHAPIRPSCEAVVAGVLRGQSRSVDHEGRIEKQGAIKRSCHTTEGGMAACGLSIVNS